MNAVVFIQIFSFRKFDYLDRVKRIWYLSPMRAAKVQEPSDRKPDPWPLWMAGHAQLQFVMTECSKTQIRLTGLI